MAARPHCPPLRQLLRRLRKHAPVPYPVRVVYRKRPTMFLEGKVQSVHGYTRVIRTTTHKPVRFRIVLDSRFSREHQWDVLVHEWAHVLDRTRRGQRLKDCHDSRWGAAYSRAFKASVTT